MAYKIFISHSSIDTWVAAQIERHINEAGAITFLDERDIHAGDNFGEKLREELNQAEELLVLCTPWAINRANVILEVGVVWGRRKRIIAILHGIDPNELQKSPYVTFAIKESDLIVINDISEYFTQLNSRISNFKSMDHGK